MDERRRKMDRIGQLFTNVTIGASFLFKRGCRLPRSVV
jgi:hypothetical protein